ncbi:hypothetical protein phi9181_ORF066 [Enterococcus phage 9181]|nr:hypothetical protein phi9181_ORF066 [Enterococcus phage 9181]
MVGIRLVGHSFVGGFLLWWLNSLQRFGFPLTILL